MKKFYVPFLIAIATTFAWAQGPPSSKALEQAREQVKQFGSHVAYAQMRMLENKLGLDPKKSKRYYRLSRATLLTDLSGGMTSNNSRTRGDLDLITGKRAIEESLQTSSVRSRQTDNKERTIALSEIESLKIESHPWAEMIKKVGDGPNRPGILALVPSDHFMLFAEGGNTFKKLEEGLQELAEGAGNLFEIQEKLKVREQVSRRLGVGAFRDLEALISRSVFVSEDLDFYPNTHYALILDADPLIRATASMFLTKTPWQAKVGDYLVLSTSQPLLERIKATHQGKVPNMRDSLDFRYANAVLESRRDALAYLSEQFILKLVGPGYRINAARRMAASERLSALQYTVLAYRTLEDRWPVSFQQMADEGYISKVDDKNFSIDSQGVVNHHIWGSLYDIKALSEVPIDKVSKLENDRYNRFREGYQSFWREFFDPVGMSISVDDRLSVHTIILPLIDNGDYRWLQVLTGGEAMDFDAHSTGLPHFPIRMHSRFQFDEALLSFFTRHSQREKTVEDKKKAINNQIRSWIRLDEDFSIFDIIGDEMAVSFGTEFSLNSRFDDSQVVLSLKLKDRERFQKFWRVALPALGGGTSHRSQGTHRGQSYVTYGEKGEKRGLLCALYADDFVHLTTNEKMIKQVCEAVADRQRVSDAGWPGEKRTGRKHNILFLMDLLPLEHLKQELAHLEDRNWVNRQVQQVSGYLWDANLLSKAGVEKEFFREVPSQLFGIPVTNEEGEIKLGGRALADIAFEYRYVTRRLRKRTKVETVEKKPDPRIAVRDLLKEFYDPNRIAQIGAFENVAVGMKFTPEGLSTRVSVNNPAHD